MLEINKIYNMDCLEGMKLIEDGSVDLVVIDPPYKLISGGRKNSKLVLNTSSEKDLKSGDVFKTNTIKSSEWFRELYRVLKEGTHCYVMCNDKYVKEYLTNAEEVGFKEVNILVWNKGMHTPTQYYMKNIEFILMFRKGSAKYINNMGSFALINIKGIKGNKIHPSEKPVELMKHLIDNSAKENDIVLDCFMGSGATAIACLQSEKQINYIGFELDNTYYDILNNRIEDYKNK